MIHDIVSPNAKTWLRIRLYPEKKSFSEKTAKKEEGETISKQGSTNSAKIGW
jgi:hypothetical protein